MEDAITLGLQVTDGRVILTSFDGKPAVSPAAPTRDPELTNPAKDELRRKHQCARDVLGTLRLPDTRELSGVVAVILE